MEEVKGQGSDMETAVLRLLVGVRAGPSLERHFHRSASFTGLPLIRECPFHVSAPFRESPLSWDCPLCRACSRFQRRKAECRTR